MALGKGGRRVGLLVTVASMIVFLVVVPSNTAVGQTNSPVTVSMSVSASPVSVGDEVRVTAVVAGRDAVGTPTGNVLFAVDGRAGTRVALVDGAATLPLSDLDVGVHTVTAAYDGDGTFAAGDAGPGARIVVVPGGTSRYVPLTPARLLDTRPGSQTGFSGGKPNSGGVVQLQVAGRGGVPVKDVSAVVLNVTATETEGAGFVTVYPADGPRPLASNLNPEFVGQTIPNLVVVPLSASGQVALYTLVPAHLVADVAGYFTPTVSAADGRLVPVTPARLLDTRSDGPQTGYTGPKPGAGATVGLQVTGRGGVPADGVAAVALNVTATNTGASGGYITAYPDGVSRPLASNLNFTRVGQTIPNAVWVPVSSAGRINLFASQSTDLVVDVVGWFTTSRASQKTSGLFVPTSPSRVLDTRVDGPQKGYSGQKPGPNAVVAVRGAPIPAASAAAVVTNVTGVDATGTGYVSAYPAGQPRPLASSLNLDLPGQTRPNLVTSPLGENGTVNLFTQSGTHLLADVAGWFTNDLDPAPATTQHTTAEAAPGTLTLPPDGVTAVTGDSTTGYTVRLPAGAAVPAQGTAVVLQGGGAVYPSGLAGRVTAVKPGIGGTTDVTLAPVALDEVFRVLDVGYDGPADLIPTTTAATPAARADVTASDIGGGETSVENSLIDFGAGAFDCDVSTGVSVSASLVRFENTRVHFEQRVGFGVAPYVSFYVQTEPVVRFSGEVHGKVTCELSAAFRNTHRLVWTLPTSVPVTVDLAPALRFEATVAGNITFTERFYRMVGFSTNPDLSIRTYNAGSQATEDASVGADVSASLLIGADASVKLLDVAGAGITLGPEFKASVDQSRCVELSVAITADFDLRINLWIKQFKYTVLTLRLGPWTLFRQCPGGGTHPLSIVTGDLGPYPVSQAVNVRLQASGGVSPYSWQAVNLPPGLALSAQGVLTGTPTAGGVSTATITVRDQPGTTVSRDFRITVTSPVTVGPTAWATAHAHLVYVQYLDVQPYCDDRDMVYRADGLPPGLSLVGGWAFGIVAVSGVTDALGTYGVTVTITCRGQTTTLRVTLKVAPAPDSGPDGVPNFGMSVGSSGSTGYDPGYAGPWVSAAQPSPDGRHIATILGATGVVAVYDKNSTTMIPLTYGLSDSGIGYGGADSNLAWSPDGRYLAFVSRENLDAPEPGDPDGNHGWYDVFVWDSHTGTTRRITDSPPFGYGTQSDTPVWSPDGTLLAFNSRDQDHTVDRVRTWRPATNQLSDLPCGNGQGCRAVASSTPGATEPWTADSQHLTMMEHRPGDFYGVTGLRVWDRAGGSRLLSTADRYFGARLTQDGRKAVVEQVQGNIRTTHLVDVLTGAVMENYTASVTVNPEAVAPSVFSRSGGHFVLWACFDTPTNRCGPAIVDTDTGATDASLVDIGSIVGWVGDTAVFVKVTNQYCYTAVIPGGIRRTIGCYGFDWQVGSDGTGLYLSHVTAPGTVGLRRIAV